jgi:hypothetical protein
MTDKKDKTEQVKPEAIKAKAKHRKLSKEELAALKCTAPQGKRELAPGKSFCVGAKSFKPAIFSVQPDKAGNEELKRDRVKSCYVPDALLKGIKPKDGVFLAK